MRIIEQALIEVEGYPHYRDEIRYYVSNNGLITHGPFQFEDEAEEAAFEHARSIDSETGFVTTKGRNAL